MNLLTDQSPVKLSFRVLIIAVISISFVVGVSYFIYNSPLTPLIIAAVPIALIATITCLYKPRLALYAALLLVLLPMGVFSADIQTILNRVLTIFALLVWLVHLIIRRRHIRWTVTAVIMLGFLVWSSVTVLWAQNLESSMYELGSYLLRFILFLLLIINEIDSRKALNGLMFVVAVSGWVFILAGIISIFINGYTVGNRLQILSENENTLGALFPLLAVGAIWPAVQPQTTRRTFWKLQSLAFIILSLVFIALNGSRGGLISWFLTILVFLFWRKTRLWGIVGLVTVAGAIIVAPMILSTTIERFLLNSGSSLLGGREALWEAAWWLIRDNILIGVGIGNAPNAMMPYIIYFRNVGESEWVAIHNPILTIIAEVGIAGILLYLGVIISSIWSFVRQFIRYNRSGPEWLQGYFPLVVAAFFGYFASWIKGGGMESSFSLFLMLALMLIPTNLEIKDL